MREPIVRNAVGQNESRYFLRVNIDGVLLAQNCESFSGAATLAFSAWSDTMYGAAVALTASLFTVLFNGANERRCDALSVL